jgi:UDP-glucose 4-epimerase
MRVLVTGGAGFIGSNLVDRLLAHGHQVFVVDDLSFGKLTNLDDARAEGGVHFHQFDVRSPGMRDVVTRTQPEVVCHLAAQGAVPRSVAEPIYDAEVNVIGLLNVLEACVVAGVRKVVFASSGGTIYGPQAELPVAETAVGVPGSPYGITKLAAEHYLRFFRSEHGLDFTSLALANVYGPRQDPYGEAGVVAIFSAKIVDGEAPTIFGTGEFTRDYVYVDDVAHAFVLALDKGSGETFNVGTGLGTSVNDLFETLARVAGSSLKAEYGPPRPGDIPHSALDPSKARDGLGWQPWTTLEDGLRDTIAWFKR